MNKIFLVSLESVPTRYTAQWKVHLPKMLEQHTKKQVIDIEGSSSEIEATPGAFLNFAATNVFKSEQAIKIAKLFEEGSVSNGDIFLFADAWNPVIIQTRYMIDLLGIHAEIHSIWHAGSYDPADLLGQKIEDKRWSKNFERSVYHACHVNYFATDFHIELMTDNLQLIDDGSIVRTGFPMEFIEEYTVGGVERKPIVIFPHRTSPEKQIDLFREIKRRSEETDLGFECFICQDHKLTKPEYYKKLAESTIMFSANLQETLGLSALDALASGTDIMVPDRLSYSEMYSDRVFFDDLVPVDDIIKEIQDRIKKYDITKVRHEYDRVKDRYFSGKIMYSRLAE